MEELAKRRNRKKQRINPRIAKPRAAGGGGEDRISRRKEHHGGTKQKGPWGVCGLLSNPYAKKHGLIWSWALVQDHVKNDVRHPTWCKRNKTTPSSKGNVG